MEKPILFNTDMVKAILDGRKTQTRRLPSSSIRDAWSEWDEYQSAVAPPGSRLETEEGFYKKHPPYKEGDILYVRETWKQATGGTAGPGLFDTILYKADEPQDTTGLMIEERWHPSIHMPKSAARIFLKVISVRLEKLQEITHEDVIAEGVQATMLEAGHPDNPYKNSECIRYYFDRLWDSTIKKTDLCYSGWDANPYVWVIEFERMTKRQMLAYANKDAVKYADSGVLMPAT